MDIWEAIYQSTANLPESNPLKKQEYFRYKNQINQCYNYLHDHLSDNELKMLERLTKKQNKFLEIETMRFFAKGFKSGMSLAIETLN